MIWLRSHAPQTGRLYRVSGDFVQRFQLSIFLAGLLMIKLRHPLEIVSKLTPRSANRWSPVRPVAAFFFAASVVTLVGCGASSETSTGSADRVAPNARVSTVIGSASVGSTNAKADSDAVTATGNRDGSDPSVPDAQRTSSAMHPVVENASQRDWPDEASRRKFVQAMHPSVQHFCGDCHVMPRPTSSTIDDWVDEVHQGYMLYKVSGRSDLDVPDQEDVLRYFQYQAPERLELPSSIENYVESPVQFDATFVDREKEYVAAVTHVRWTDLGIGDTPALLYTDVGNGSIRAVWPQEPSVPPMLIGTTLQPVHAEAADLDGDGNMDVLVADIGEFDADDSDVGRVVWFRKVPGESRFEKRILVDHLSRVSDARAADFDRDGDLDVLVGVFGWRQTGQIFLLENLNSQTDVKQAAALESVEIEGREFGVASGFRYHRVDPRHGCVNVCPTDLNGDGNLDFVALLSQGYETVEAFFGDGGGEFRSETLYRAPDPAYGSSGIELCDFDRDGDTDVIYTNGDSFDRGPKLHHSVQWLENLSDATHPADESPAGSASSDADGESARFRHHHVLQMPGVLNAKPADMDGDGDLDLVAVSLLAKPVGEQLMDRNTSSIVYLRRDAGDVFTPFQIEAGNHQHISVAAADLDADGKTDLAVGTFARQGSADDPELVLWMNRGPASTP